MNQPELTHTSPAILLVSVSVSGRFASNGSNEQRSCCCLRCHEMSSARFFLLKDTWWGFVEESLLYDQVTNLLCAPALMEHDRPPFRPAVTGIRAADDGDGGGSSGQIRLSRKVPRYLTHFSPCRSLESTKVWFGKCGVYLTPD